MQSQTGEKKVLHKHEVFMLIFITLFLISGFFFKDIQGNILTGHATEEELQAFIEANPEEDQEEDQLTTFLKDTTNVIDFGYVYLDQYKTQQFTLTNTASTPYILYDIEVSNAHPHAIQPVTSTFEEAFQLQPGEATNIQLTFHVSSQDTTLFINPQDTQEEYPLYGEIITYTDQEGTEEHHTPWIATLKNQPIPENLEEQTPDYTKLTTTLLFENIFTFFSQFFTQPTTEQETLPQETPALPEQELVPHPARIDLTAKINEQHKQQFTLTNTASTAFLIGTITTPPNTLVIPPGTNIINPGEQATYTIICAPLKQETITGSITFTYTQGKTLTIPLTCTGTPTQFGLTYLDTQQPTIKVFSPQPEEKLTGITPIHIGVYDGEQGSGISSVRIFTPDTDGKERHLTTFTDYPYKWMWNTRNYPAGKTELIIKALDNAGNQHTTTLPITIKGERSLKLEHQPHDHTDTYYQASIELNDGTTIPLTDEIELNQDTVDLHFTLPFPLEGQVITTQVTLHNVKLPNNEEDYTLTYPPDYFIEQEQEGTTTYHVTNLQQGMRNLITTLNPTAVSHPIIWPTNPKTGQPYSIDEVQIYHFLPDGSREDITPHVTKQPFPTDSRLMIVTVPPQYI